MKEYAKVAPLTIGPLNCEAALGVPWSWAKDKACDLRVPVIKVGNRTLIPADEMLAALKKHGVIYVPDLPPADVGSPEAMEAMRTRLGQRLMPEEQKRWDELKARLRNGEIKPENWLEEWKRSI